MIGRDIEPIWRDCQELPADGEVAAIGNLKRRYLCIRICMTYFSLVVFKKKAVFLAAFKTVHAIFAFTTRAIFTDFKPLHSLKPFTNQRAKNLISP